MTQTYKVQVSMNQAHIVESGFVWKQGDFGFNIEIEVLDFDTTGATPQIIFRKSTGAVEATEITRAENKFTYAIRGTELDTPGPCVCDLKLNDSTTKRVSTASFKYFVIPDTMDGLEQEASSYSDTIEQLLENTLQKSSTSGLVKNDGSINTTIETSVLDQEILTKDVGYRAITDTLQQWVPFHCTSGDKITVKTADESNFTITRIELKRANNTSDWWSLDTSKSSRTIVIEAGEEFFYARIANGTAQKIYFINDSSFYNFYNLAAMKEESVIDKGLKENQDIDKLIDIGSYFVASASHLPSLYTNGFVDVKHYSLDSTTTYVVQVFIPSESLSNGCRAYIRRSSYISSGNVTWSSWEELTDNSVKTFVRSLSYIDKGIKENQDLNALFLPGDYFISSGSNMPANFTTGYVNVNNYSLDSSTTYAVQTFISRNVKGTKRIFARSSSYFNGGSASWSEWAEMSNNENSIDKGALNGENLNGIYLLGNYYAYNCLNRPNNTGNGFLAVSRYSLDSSTTYVVQIYTEVATAKQYSRRSTYIQSTPVNWSDWKQITNDDSLAGKVIVNFGDSIFGNWDDTTSISYNIAKNTGATVYNCGFGGCRMSNYNTNATLNAFSMCNLIDAIISNDYSLQEEKATSAGAPDYFASRVQRLESIDFSKVDIITIAYGCNDVTNDVLVDNEQNQFDKNTYCGALRYTLKRFSENYPQIKIVVLPPIYEVYLENGEYDFDSDDPEFGIKIGFTHDTDRLFTDWVEGAINVAKENHIISFDEYYETGFNKYNFKTFYGNFPTQPDGTHPNETGRIRRGERLAAKLKSVF